VNDPHRKYEIRCPLHGFITLNDWEWSVISQPAFQRLRRIRQLGWTDYIYPGAMHTRFEHSLGVMHVATRLYEAIKKNSREVLESDLGFTQEGLERDKQLVRFAALLHDVGHSPFSHASEELFPLKKDGTRYSHEDCSVAILTSELRSAIEEHPLNNNWRFTAEDIAALIQGSAAAKQGLFWRDLISGQMDADRMDYLQRDAYHAGVQYGRFDLNRLVATTRAIRDKDGGQPRLGISEGGVHAAEGLVLARYFMFTQIYFHKTRVAYDVHLRGAMKELLTNQKFPAPAGGGIKRFLKWDDWKVLGLLAGGKGGEHGKRMLERKHYRRVYWTSETPDKKGVEEAENVRKKLGTLFAAEERAAKSWYKTGRDDDIPVFDEKYDTRLPLSEHSNVVKNLQANNQIFLYVRPEDVGPAEKIVREVKKHGRSS